MSLNFIKAQTGWVEPTEILIPDGMEKITSDSIISVSEIDFTGNGKTDFLMTTLIPMEHYYKKWFWWIRDDFTVYRKIEIGIANHEIWKYINLDDDPELEIVSAWGYEDGIDYSINDPDYESNGFLKNSVLFSPVVKYKNGLSWGYSRYWDFMMYDQKSRSIEVLFEHSIVRDGNIEIPETYKMPVLFFETDAQPTFQMEPLKGESVWVTLDELFRRLK